MITLTFAPTFGNLLSSFLGLILGASWAASVYLKIKRKKVLTHIEPDFNKIPDEKRKLYLKYIDNIYSYHEKSRKNKIKILFGLVEIKRNINYKELAKTYLDLDDVKDTEPLSLVDEIKWLVEKIAKDNYENSNYPLFELTIDEIFDLMYRAIDLTSDVINDLGIPGLNQISIKLILNASQLGEKVFEIFNKGWVKVLLKIYNAAFKISKLINPAYWIKKITNVVSNDSLISFIYYIMFEITGKLTANIYMKNKIEVQTENEVI